MPIKTLVARQSMQNQAVAEAFKSVCIDEPNSPLFPFGFGLSYTSFTYQHLNVENPVLSPDDTLFVTTTIKNSGNRAGDEVVQLYVRDLPGSITRPVQELKGFQKIHPQPGENKLVRFSIPASELGFTGQEMQYKIEPGKYKLWVGPDSTRGLEGDFELTHPS